MALKIDKLQLEIEIQQNQAIQSLKNLEGEIKDAKKELHKFKKDSEEYNTQKTKIKELSDRYEQLSSEIKLTDMPLSLLVKRQRELTAAISNMKPSSESYAKYRAELDATKARISELRGTAKDTGLSLSKFADGFNKYAALATGAIASITGVAMTARKSVDDFAKMSEAEAQVSKYTDLTAQEISQLNEKFKNMDTRTPREQLNALAGQAGQLGIKGSDNIMSFVSAADKINVALGEDIGADAVKTIGRLTQMFGEDKKLGLSKAMLSTGSAINQLAQSVGADATYLVDFENRVGGVAKQAKISQAQILGYAGVLNKNGQQVEMAGTAVQSVLMKMYQAPAKFAKLAGQDVTKFTTLLKKDANEAFLQLLTTLQKQGGLDKLAPIFKDMGLDGARASSVLTTLADKISDVREQQQIATVAYKEAKSVDNEFNVQNNTVQAGLDKAKKHFKDLSIELGERLEPVMRHMITSTSSMIKVMLELTRFTIDHKGAIISLLSVMAAYIIAAKLNVFWTTKMKNAEGEYIIVAKLSAYWKKIQTASIILYTAAINLFTGKIGLAKEGLLAFCRVLKLNPWGLALAAITAIVAAIILFNKRTVELNELTKTQIKIHKEAIDKYSEEAAKVQSLSAIVHNSTLPYQMRLRALNQLKEIAPGYHATLTKEGKLINDNTIALDNYLANFKRKVVMEASESAMRDAIQKKITSEMRLNRVKSIASIYNNEMKNLSSGVNSGNTDAMNSYWFFQKLRDQYVEEQKMRENEMSEQDRTIKYLEAYTGKSAKNYYKNKTNKSGSSGGGSGNGDTSNVGNTPTGTTSTSNKTGSTDKKDLYQESLKELEQYHQQRLLDLKKYGQEENLTEAQYNLNSIKENERYLISKKNVIDKFSKIPNKDNKSKIADDKIQTDTQILDLQKQHNEAELRLLQENRDNQLSAREQLYNEEKQELAKHLADGSYTQEEYDSRILDLELFYKNARVDILKQYSDALESSSISDLNIKTKAAKDANAAVLQADIESSTEKARKRKSEEDKEKQQQDKLKEIKDKYGLITDKEKYDEQLKLLDDFHQKGLLSEEQYQQAVKKLSEDTNQDKKIDWQKTAQAISQIAGSLSDSISGFAEAETIASDARYDRRIKAAKKAGKDTTKLEEEKEAAQLKIKKKYADMQFAAAVLQIASTTAVTAMEAYKAMAGIPVVGPALGAAAAAAAVLAGAAQIKVAKANRDAAKGLYSGGYSDDYVNGYTSTGDSHQVAGVIPVHKNEFVANHEAVENPAVRQFLDIFNVAQLNGRIRFLDTTAILSQLNLTGKYSGGYATSQPKSATTPVITTEGSSNVDEKLDRILIFLDLISKKKLVIAMTDVRDGLDDLNALESNASR